MSRQDVQTTKVYVGNLPPDARKEELERAFERYGKLHDVWVARNPPGFAFVEFYDNRDAKDACKDLDGSRLCGASARVEISHGRGKGGGRGRGGGGGGRPNRDRYGGRDDRGGRHDDHDDRYGRRSPPRYVMPCKAAII